MDELLPYVEARYKVSRERKGRAIGGLSMGGYGALNLALRHPEKFCAAGDHDFLGIAVMSANLYWRLRQIQPKQAELRIIDGDHEWLVFRDALPEALQYVDRTCARG